MGKNAAIVAGKHTEKIHMINVSHIVQCPTRRCSDTIGIGMV